MDCGRSQGVVIVCLLKLVQDCTERCFCLYFSTFFLFIYIFLVYLSMDCGFLFVRNFRIIRSSMIGFFFYVQN